MILDDVTKFSGIFTGQFMDKNNPQDLQYLEASSKFDIYLIEIGLF